MHLLPKSRISHSSSTSQLSKRLSSWSLPKQAVVGAQWTDDQHFEQGKDHFLIDARRNGTRGISNVIPAFYFFIQLIFWLIFSAARANVSLITFPYHSPFIQLVGSLAPRQPSVSAFSVNAQLLLASAEKKSVTY
jgi:hypothetical protein